MYLLPFTFISNHSHLSTLSSSSSDDTSETSMSSSISAYYFNNVSFWKQSFIPSVLQDYGVYDEQDENACLKAFSAFNIMRRLHVTTPDKSCTVSIQSRRIATFQFDILQIQEQNTYSRLLVAERNSFLERGTVRLYIPLNKSSCTFYTRGEDLILFVSLVTIDIGVRIVNADYVDTTCNERLVKVDPCFFTSYLANIKMFPWTEKEMVVYEIESFCPKFCVCTLSYGKFITKCSNGTSEIFFDCFLYIAGVSFNNKRINKLDSLAFHCFKSMRKLLLSMNRLEMLPKHIFSALEHLRVLILSDNYLTDLPSGIFDNQRNLKHLDLTYNAITKLPDSLLSHCLLLELFFLGGNVLYKIPNDTFVGLKKLRDVMLTDNKLVSLPTDLFETQDNVEALFLTDNKMTKLSRNKIYFFCTAQLTTIAIRAQCSDNAAKRNF